jgi:thioredoxin 1
MDGAAVTPPSRLRPRSANQGFVTELSRNDVDALPGATLLEFGASWCGYCQAAQPMITRVLADHPEVRHVKIEDGPGKRLGRSFQIKLWPTLVLLVDGREVARFVRPTNGDGVRAALAQSRDQCWKKLPR